MVLKSVELLGFKSFAERTLIEFQKGISTILGPNGCGKSNVVDAIKWVIGEQSSKTLRAGKMHEVIFNGTENRKALNVAEVTITFENTEGRLPLDMAEVAIKRRIYRSGESEYFINKNQVKLKDVKELFFDTGVGKSAYSVMEQGRIDQILSNKPENRRYIFEEAAGITKFKIREQEAERKLNKTNDNMRQIESIIKEVKKNYDGLKRQSDKTVKYRELKDKIFHNEKNIQLLNLKELFKRRNDNEESLNQKRDKKLIKQKAIDTINASMEQNIDLVNTMESQLIEKQKKLYGIDLEKNNKDSQIKILKERIHELERKIREDELREKEITKKISDLTLESEEKVKILEELLKSTKDIEENINGFIKDIEHFTNKIETNENNITKNENEITSLEEKIEELRLELRSVTDNIVMELDKQLKDTGYSHSERLKLEENLDETLKSLKILLKGNSSLIQDILDFGNTNKDDFKKKINSIKEKISNSELKVDSLIELFTTFKKSMPNFIDEFLAPDGTITKKREIDQNISKSVLRISELKKENEGFRADNKNLLKKINEYRKTLEELRINKARMEAKKTSLEQEIRRLTGEVQEQKKILEKNSLEMTTTAEKIEEITGEISKLGIAYKSFEKEETVLKKELSGLEKDITTRNKSLITKEKSLKSEMDNLLKLQSDIEKFHVKFAEANSDIKNIYGNFSENHGRDLTEFESKMFSIKVPIADLKSKLSAKKSELKNLGQLNLMAPEEFQEVKERYDFLQGQMTDLVRAKQDLEKITNEIRTESEEMFLNTYNKIRKNFNIMFRRLFGGGRAALKLLDTENVLDSGIDILAQPPGKKLESIALLSGGERSLTAIGILLATYLVKPSPFCILDEIDAAMDDANIGRFINVLKEFADKSQFIMISHNKKTIANSNTMLGITMEESGVSKLITIKLKNKNDK